MVERRQILLQGSNSKRLGGVEAAGIAGGSEASKQEDQFSFIHAFHSIYKESGRNHPALRD